MAAYWTYDRCARPIEPPDDGYDWGCPTLPTVAKVYPPGKSRPSRSVALCPRCATDLVDFLAGHVIFPPARYEPPAPPEPAGPAPCSCHLDAPKPSPNY